MVLRTFNLRIFPFEMNFRAEESIFLLYFFFVAFLPLHFFHTFFSSSVSDLNLFSTDIREKKIVVGWKMQI